MGCGDALLASSLSSTNKVYSFDLVSKNETVIAADIANVPLQNNSVDIVVFCLSLMGSNISDFLSEAHRILKPNGILKVAEVRSRFEGERNGMETFLQILQQVGFQLKEKNIPNKMFFILECSKTSKMADVDKKYSAKACVYKKR